jgi:hypothetical protein
MKPDGGAYDVLHRDGPRAGQLALDWLDDAAGPSDFVRACVAEARANPQRQAEMIRRYFPRQTADRILGGGAQDRAPPQSSSTEVNNMTYLDRFPMARRITSMDSAAPRGQDDIRRWRDPTFSSANMRNGQDQEYGSGEMPPRGSGVGSYVNGNNNGRDPRNPSNLSTQGAFAQSLDQTSPRPASVPSPSGYSGNMRGSRPPAISDQEENNGAEMTPEMLAQFVEMCRQRLLSQDDEGAGHNAFMQYLAEILSQAHENGNGNDRRPRSGSRGSAGDRRIAGDSAALVRQINSSSYEQRFGTGHIKLGNYLSDYSRY